MLICDHCRWTGEPDAAHPHPREDRALCPACWEAGYEAPVRERFGPLVEAVAPNDPGPRVRKALIDWTDDDWDAEARIARAREAHERADVLLPTDLVGCK